MRRRKSGLVINWSKTLTILSPWKRDKTDAVVDSGVVLTKVKVLCRSQRNLLAPADSSVPSAFHLTCQDQTHSIANLEATIQSPCPDSQFWGPREDHVDSEDSGLDSPSSPLRSHTSPMHNSSVHSRGSSCDSGNSDQKNSSVQGPDVCTDLSEPEEVSLTVKDAGFEHSSEKSQNLPKDEARTWSSSAEFAEECCRLQTQSLSGLGYLEQVCRLVERISRLQDLVLHLQRELRTQRLNKSPDRSMERGLDHHKLTFLMQRCTCGASDLLRSEVQCQTKSLSHINLQHNLSADLRTVQESVPRVLSRRESAPCRRRSRQSFTEDHYTWSNDLHTELSHRSSLSWGHVQDFVRTKSKSRLRPGSLKMSCPQLHRLDRVQTRNSMILLNQSPD